MAEAKTMTISKISAEAKNTPFDHGLKPVAKLLSQQSNSKRWGYTVAARREHYWKQLAGAGHLLHQVITEENHYLN